MKQITLCIFILLYTMVIFLFRSRAIASGPKSFGNTLEQVAMATEKYAKVN